MKNSFGGKLFLFFEWSSNEEVKFLLLTAGGKVMNDREIDNVDFVRAKVLFVQKKQ
jgi:hypothetical protein